MHFEREFTVRRSRAELAALLDDDATLAALLPDTTVSARPDGVRETRTPSPLGQARDIRFLFHRSQDGLRFEKICDGNVWRSLDGEVRMEALEAGTTRVRVRLEGRTRALVPELAIRGPMRDQIDQMSGALRARFEAAEPPGGPAVPRGRGVDAGGAG